jgi:anhydro-N-acetylmuramic acid kinase
MQCNNEPYDKDGAFARSGKIDEELLKSFLQDPYFAKSAPKSTGREYFNDSWLASHFGIFQTSKNEDIQRTLLELTARTITNDLKKADVETLIICGGGAKNSFLMERLAELSGKEVFSSTHFGVDGDFMEAMAFAWLAYKRIHNQQVALSSVTGAKKDSLLGAIYG